MVRTDLDISVRIHPNEDLIVSSLSYDQAMTRSFNQPATTNDRTRGDLGLEGYDINRAHIASPRTTELGLAGLTLYNKDNRTS